jgi:mono/diheme cytochrome c family protein
MPLALVLLAALAAPARAVEAPDRAAALYAAHCAACHGPQGHGDGPDAALFRPRPRDLREVLRHHADVDIVRTIRLSAPLPLALDPPAVRARVGEVEAIAAHVRRLPGADWPRVDRGRVVFARACAGCHGELGTPPPGPTPPRDLADPAFQRSVSDVALAEAVRHGRPGMVPVPGLAPEDPEALAAFVRLLSPGYVLYRRWCASCHGEDGLAGDVVDPGRAPRVRFDREWVRTTDPERLRVAVWHMLDAQRPAMPHFGRVLTEAEAAAIVAALRRLQEPPADQK